MEKLKHNRFLPDFRKGDVLSDVLSQANRFTIVFNRFKPYCYEEEVIRCDCSTYSWSSNRK